jgi:hypothetical protein
MVVLLPLEGNQLGIDQKVTTIHIYTKNHHSLERKTSSVFENAKSIIHKDKAAFFFVDLLVPMRVLTAAKTRYKINT